MSKFDSKHFIKWVKNHYWDSLEKDKDLILRHLRTYFGDDIVSVKDDNEGYRLLEPGEFARYGDEFLNSDGIWIAVHGDCGDCPVEVGDKPIRRKIDE